MPDIDDFNITTNLNHKLFVNSIFSLRSLRSWRFDFKRWGDRFPHPLITDLSELLIEPPH